MIPLPQSPESAHVAGRDLARALDPVLLLGDAGITADPWQANALRSAGKRALWLCCRQSGKSTIAAGKALHRALYAPASLCLLLSPSLRQSGELFRKVLDLYRAVDGLPDASAESALRIEFPNGSRIVSLPGSDSTVRGYSKPSLVVIDEAAHCQESFISATLPMLAASPDGQLLVLSTPNGRQGFFHEAWHGDDTFEKTRITWRDCPRIPEDAVNLYRATVGDLMCRQEFLCEFLDTAESVFPSAIIEAMFDDTVTPLWS